MAVPQNKKSSSRTRMRRARAKLAQPVLCVEAGAKGRPGAASELRRRHHLGSDGIYRGTQFFVPKSKTVEVDDDE